MRLILITKKRRVATSTLFFLRSFLREPRTFLENVPSRNFQKIAIDRRDDSNPQLLKIHSSPARLIITNYSERTQVQRTPSLMN